MSCRYRILEYLFYHLQNGIRVPGLQGAHSVGGLNDTPLSCAFAHGLTNSRTVTVLKLHIARCHHCLGVIYQTPYRLGVAIIAWAAPSSVHRDHAPGRAAAAVGGALQENPARGLPTPAWARLAETMRRCLTPRHMRKPATTEHQPTSWSTPSKSLWLRPLSVT